MTEWNNITTILNNLSAIEIGGPTQLFWDKNMLPLYHKFKIIDNINSNIFDVHDNIRDTEHSKIFRTNYDMDATNLDFNILNEKYDACISSHTIEHIANPILFLNNIKNLLKEEGLILSILPNKTEFWDRVREYTSMEHLIQDFENNVSENDLTHLYENFNTDHPWKRIHGVESCKKLFMENFKNRGLHHHCFNTELVKNLHEYCGFTTIYCNVLMQDKLQIVYIGKLNAENHN